MLVQKRQSVTPNYLRRLEAADIGSLRIFCAVVETSSFSAAARLLNLAPSTISKHVDALEHALERPLIQRTTRQLSITEAGRVFFDQCQVALSALSAAVDYKNGEASHNVTGKLRVTAPPALSQTILAPRLSEFVRLNPGITLDYCVTAASADLIAEQIDIAIRIDDQPCTKYPSIYLGEERRVFCASPSFIDQNGCPDAPEDLKGFNCLVNVYTAHQHAWPVRIQGRDTAVDINGTFACNSGDILRRLCLDGVGIGLFSLSHVRQDILRGHLVEILSDYQMPTRSIFALVPHKKYLSECAKAFLDFVQRAIALSSAS
ncbi:LysR family transcriptional regulator [Bradyrhizobium sp. WSM3983]|uniref:LysR family transcriptional regulator n=1 Tax=Bradyrhizobium sp. WSM3983 TaxID=1038867 RepID=UPI0018DCF345|nr:LysR family transcriptional regulator [Bradyrhizobium sp. WSM3983]